MAGPQSHRCETVCFWICYKQRRRAQPKKKPQRGSSNVRTRGAGPDFHSIATVQRAMIMGVMLCSQARTNVQHESALRVREPDSGYERCRHRTKSRKACQCRLALIIVTSRQSVTFLESYGCMLSVTALLKHILFPSNQKIIQRISFDHFLKPAVQNTFETNHSDDRRRFYKRTRR